MLADGIQLEDGRAGPQQTLRNVPFFFQRDAVGGSRPQGRPSAGYKTEHDVVFGEPGDEFASLLNGPDSGSIWNGMTRLNDTNSRHGERMSIFRRDHAGRDMAAQNFFDDLRHPGTGLA